MSFITTVTRANFTTTASWPQLQANFVAKDTLPLSDLPDTNEIAAVMLGRTQAPHIRRRLPAHWGNQHWAWAPFLGKLSAHLEHEGFDFSPNKDHMVVFDFDDTIASFHLPTYLIAPEEGRRLSAREANVAPYDDSAANVTRLLGTDALQGILRESRAELCFGAFGDETLHSSPDLNQENVDWAKALALKPNTSLICCTARGALNTEKIINDTTAPMGLEFEAILPIGDPNPNVEHFGVKEFRNGQRKALFLAGMMTLSKATSLTFIDDGVANLQAVKELFEEFMPHIELTLLQTITTEHGFQNIPYAPEDSASKH